MRSPLTGCFTALVTPFRDGRVDLVAFRALIDWQFASGITGIVPAGTTGEGYALSTDEYRSLLRSAVAAARGRGPVIAGAGTHSTAATVSLVREAQDSGCDAVLVVTPYYCRPPQRGLLEHYRAVAEVGLPVVLYNVPGRTGVTLDSETALAAARIPGVVAVKEAGGRVDVAARIAAGAPPGFSVLSGDDVLTVSMIEAGASGVISTTSNVAPREMGEMVAAACGRDAARARGLHERLLPLMKALFLESNPIPVKHALALLGRIGPELRLPLVPMAEGPGTELMRALEALGLLPARASA